MNCEISHINNDVSWDIKRHSVKGDSKLEITGKKCTSQTNLESE